LWKNCATVSGRLKRRSGGSRADAPSKHSAQVQALRSVAAVECTKGILVLLAGLGALSLIHRDVWDVAESFLHFLHIDSHRHYAQVFLRLAEDATDKRLWLVAAAAVGYSTLRLVEAYGLWHLRRWAEWVALISGAIYLPFEIRELASHPRFISFAIFAINAAVVLFMLYRRTLGAAGEDSPSSLN
jgi:uncharacterized membrane protein (DUF2068 family)